MSTAMPEDQPTPDRPVWMSIAVGAAIVVAIVVLFVVFRPGDDKNKTASTPATTTAAAAAAPAPTAATPTSLAKLQTTLKHPVYWVGAQAKDTYELTQTADGSVYIRYLTPGVKLGDAQPNYLTVGTYPQADPFKTVTEASKRDGASVQKLDKGGLGVANRSAPKSWYVAYPKSKELVEVFSPDPARAKSLVKAGAVVPVKG